MSRAFDAKQATLKAYPHDREAAVNLFLGFLDCNESDFIYEFSMSPEVYIFGDKEVQELMSEGMGV